MSLIVTQRPSTTISGETSRWNAVGNPLLYKMTRKDFTIASFASADAGVNTEITISGNVASSFVVNDVVYIQTDAGVYATTGLVIASTYSAPNTIVKLGIAYISTSTGYANNETLRPNYGVEVSVYDGSNVLLNSEPFLYTPTSKGLVTIDIAAILRANMSPDFDSSLTGSTKTFTDTNAFKKFYIKYREVWTGSAESLSDDVANQFFAVYGANQIPAAYGGNLAEYVSFEDGGPLCDWLTELDTIVFWRGVPQLVSIIVGDNVSTNVLFDASGDASTAESLTGKLVAVNLDSLLTSQNSIDSANLILYKDASPDVALSETLPIELRDACEGQILLMARNKRGGFLCWMFEVAHDYTFDYGNDRKAMRKVLKTENLTLNQWEALQDFITLGDVYRNNIVELTSTTIKTTSRIGNQVYVIDTLGNKTGVVAMATKNTTNTRQLRHRFEIEIEYPEIFAL